MDHIFKWLSGPTRNTEVKEFPTEEDAGGETKWPIYYFTLKAESVIMKLYKTWDTDLILRNIKYSTNILQGDLFTK